MTLKLDFYGESTFRGYGNATERDNPQPSPSKPGINTSTDPGESGNYANVPRRVVERLWADSGVAASHENFAVSGTASAIILNGSTDLVGGITSKSGGSDANMVIINTGINDAFNGVLPAEFRANLSAIIARAVRTGKFVVIVQPNSVTNAGASQKLAEYFTGFQTWVNSLGADLSSNVLYIPTSATGDLDGTHPTNAQYETLRYQIVNALVANGNLVVLPRQRLVAELYIMMFNRAAESGGMNYWTNELATKSDVTVAHIMYLAAPNFSTMSKETLVQTWYQNLFSAPADAEGLAYWVNEINTTSEGATAIKLLHAVRNQVGTTHKLLLTHRASAGLAYGARLQRSAVNTTLVNSVTTAPTSVYAATAAI